MNELLTNIIITAILVVIISTAIRYIYKSKKKGRTCIGCPACDCAKKCGKLR